MGLPKFPCPKQLCTAPHATFQLLAQQQARLVRGLAKRAHRGLCVAQQQARFQNVAPWLAARGRRSRCCLATHGRKVAGSLRQTIRNTGPFRQPVNGESDTLASVITAVRRSALGTTSSTWRKI